MKNPLKSYRYSRQFKHEVLNEINHGNLIVLEAARYYGVSFQTIYHWIKKFGQVIASDITYIHLPRNRFCYATIISDLHTRMILGYYVSESLMLDG